VDAAPAPPGRESPIRDAGTAFLGLVGTRIELLGVELREEAFYLRRMLVVAAVAAFLLGGALVLLGVLVAAAFWETHRLLALAAVTGAYAVAGVGALMWLGSSLSQRPPPFQATVSELEADMRALRESSGTGAP
jgi:uncharacterized membrane protein YqjE